MNTRILWIAIVVIVVVVGAWFSFGRTMMPVSETATTTPVVQTDTASPLAATSVTVIYGADGFSPKNVPVRVGDTVRFVNQSGSDMWVATDDHPTHANYDGTSTAGHCENNMNTNASFDQCTRSASGTSWSYAFTKAGTFEYHNHARAVQGGTIVVE